LIVLAVLVGFGRRVSRVLIGHHGAMVGFLEDLGRKLGEAPRIGKN
jgi:hypothetical protein